MTLELCFIKQKIIIRKKNRYLFYYPVNISLLIQTLESYCTILKFSKYLAKESDQDLDSNSFTLFQTTQQPPPSNFLLFDLQMLHKTLHPSVLFFTSRAVFYAGAPFLCLNSATGVKFRGRSLFRTEANSRRDVPTNEKPSPFRSAAFFRCVLAADRL